MLLLLVLPCALFADNAHFSIDRVTIGEEDGVYMMEADLDLELSDGMMDALRSGVELLFLAEIELVRPRRWLPDETVGRLEQRYELAYHSLAQRFVVRNVNTDYRDAYPTLAEALLALGHIRQLPVIDTDLVNANKVRGQIRVRLDLAHLPMPARLGAYTDKTWRVSSDWVTWSLR